MKKNTRALLIALLICGLLAGIILAAAGTEAGQRLTGKLFARSTPTPNSKLVIDPNVGASPTPEPTKPGIAIPGWAGLSIPAGVTEATLPLHNPEANKDWYYLTFELRLKDTNEVLFATGLIPPGLYCNKVELSRPLEAGTYQCVMRVQPYFIREVPSPTNNAEFDITVSVY